MNFLPPGFLVPLPGKERPGSHALTRVCECRAHIDVCVEHCSQFIRSSRGAAADPRASSGAFLGGDLGLRWPVATHKEEGLPRRQSPRKVRF